jgi:hypothetical protein
VWPRAVRAERTSRPGQRDVRAVRRAAVRPVHEWRHVQRHSRASESPRFLACFLVVGLCVLPSCGGSAKVGGPGAPAAATPDKAAKSIAVRLEEEHRSGVLGTAALKGDERATTVTLRIDDAGREYHAHIHDVSCTDYRSMTSFSAQLATVTEGLGDVVDGKSETDVRAPLSRLAKSGFSINVHKYASPYPVVACGDIPSP